jgi:hypothetical protein
MPRNSKATTAPDGGPAAPVGVGGAIQPISVTLDKATELTGASRSRLFEAIRAKELTVRAAGRANLVEVDELRRWVKSLPTKGREPSKAA